MKDQRDSSGQSDLALRLYKVISERDAAILAIRTHRERTIDHRMCWENDFDLWEILGPDGIDHRPPGWLSFVWNCLKYRWGRRGTPAGCCRSRTTAPIDRRPPATPAPPPKKLNLRYGRSHTDRGVTIDGEELRCVRSFKVCADPENVSVAIELVATGEIDIEGYDPDLFITLQGHRRYRLVPVEP